MLFGSVIVWLSLGNIEGLPASDFFVKIAAFICPDGGPNDEGIARSAYYDAIADDPDLYGKPTESLTHEECESVLQNFMSKVVLEQLMNDIANKTITLPNNINEVAHIEEKVEQMIKQTDRLFRIPYNLAALPLAVPSLVVAFKLPPNDRLT